MKVLLISDIHGNVVALKKVLESVPRYDAVWVLGDLVDYGPDPHLVVDEVKSLKPEVIVMGNHDNAVANGVDCGCSPKIHELSVYTRVNISLKLLSDEQLAWLRSLPVIREVVVEGIKYFVVHACPKNPLHGYLLPSMSDGEVANYLSLLSTGRPVEADAVVVGHTHIPMLRDLPSPRLRVINPGSVGQPRDGDVRASCALLDAEDGSVEFVRVEYDVEEVIRRIDSLGLESRFRDWLVKILTTGRAY